MSLLSGGQSPPQRPAIPSVFPLGSSNDLNHAGKRDGKVDVRDVPSTITVFPPASAIEIDRFERIMPPQNTKPISTHTDCLGRFEGCGLVIRSDPSLRTSSAISEDANTMYEQSSWQNDDLRYDGRG
jgi:hypothetical protein